MYFRGLTYSFLLHTFFILLGANIFLDITASQKSDDKQHHNYQENNFIKLNIGAMSDMKNINQQIELHQDSENYMLEHGQDIPSYGRIVSGVLLKKLEGYSLDLKGNKVRIMLTIDKDGTLLDFTLQFSKPDMKIQNLLEGALNSNINFPPNHNKKSAARYQVLLF